MPMLTSTKFDLSTCCLDEEQKGELLSILQEYEDVFATSMNDGCAIGIEHEVITNKHQHPIHAKSYRIIPAERKAVDNAVRELKQAEIIKDSSSPWDSPILLVRKADGSLPQHVTLDSEIAQLDSVLTLCPLYRSA